MQCEHNATPTQRSATLTQRKTARRNAMQCNWGWGSWPWPPHGRRVIFDFNLEGPPPPPRARGGAGGGGGGGG
eukprot:2920343-Pyramimonas_sp.AAC.1